MDTTEQLAIERACQRLVTEYCHLVDHGRAEQIADLFSADGVWKSPEVTMNGQTEVKRGFAARQANAKRMSRHVCNNFLLNIIDDHHAEGTVYLTLYRHDGEPGRRISPVDDQPQMVGEYRDRFVRTDEGWRFEHREIEISFLRGAKG